jgi:hypothetical protein
MTSRNILKTTVLTAVLVTWMFGLPQAVPAAGTPVVKMKVELLFVQNAKDVTVDGGKLILKGIGPTVVFFSDRPERIAGHMTNDRYLKLWVEDGKDSFLADPPNATVSVFADDTETNLVVTLRNPQFTGDNLTYDISVIQGKLPEKGGPCSVFIDIIGMPLTPISYAGVARRSVYRRW